MEEGKRITEEMKKTTGEVVNLEGKGQKTRGGSREE
jgi:hypothetical protein